MTDAPGIIDRLLKHEPAQRGADDLREDRRAVIGGLWGSAAPYLLAAMCASLRKPALAVFPTEDDAVESLRDLECLATLEPGTCPQPFYLPEFEGVPEDERFVSAGTLHQRMVAVGALLAEYAGNNEDAENTESDESADGTSDAENSAPPIVVASLRSVLQGVPPPEALSGSTLGLRVGEDLSIDTLARTLETRGYTRLHRVEAPGDYAIRGGIIDLFALCSAVPVRIELFGERIESLREFDVSTQRSIAEYERLALVLVDHGELIGPGGVTGGSRAVWEFLDPDGVLALMERSALEEHAELLAREGDVPGAGARHRRLVEAAGKRRLLAMQRLAPLAHSTARNAGCDPLKCFAGDPAYLREELAALREGAGAAVAWASTEADRQRLSRHLAELDVDAETWVSVHVGSVGRAFRCDAAGVAVFNHHDMLGRVRLRRPTRAGAGTRAADDFLELAVGEHVVHATHGVGRFLRMEQVERAGNLQDFLVVEFREGTRLYVAASKIDLVQPYVGAASHKPRLDRMGGRSWDKKKKAVAKSVQDLAADLLEVEANRARRAGFPFPPETEEERRFAATFPYEETPDQISGLEDIRRDMESKRPMDRLLCGDVGFGKTELAVRAAFKAVRAGKQVAVLAPTTILVEQHVATFRERMQGSHILVEGLSRFRTAREQKQVIGRAARGEVDVVIGTHRLLSGDVSFRDLGLVVIDEEQRFGVEHKERLKRLKHTVDVLTLTATPIPRSLHMALLGIRDISSLVTPPRDRLAVITEVLRFDPRVVRRGVLFELSRGGQVFFLHNRVRELSAMERMLARNVPEARVVTLHGQMPERKIEAGMKRFLDREADVLLCTSIIESGLDIPAANTIFVNRADRFGLADLHQLRGRVGRAGVRAYAYFMLPGDVEVSPVAERRLRAIEEFAALGSGFKIAMKDLEIRGAGNVLGREQSGHIAAVGYDMYCRLLERAVRRLRGEDVASTERVFLDLSADAHIPASYVPDERTRLELYRRASRSETRGEAGGLRAEMRDRFGQPPGEVETLLSIIEIRGALARAGISRVVEYEHGLRVDCASGETEPARRFFQLANNRVNDGGGGTLYVILDPSERDPAWIVAFLLNLARGKRSGRSAGISRAKDRTN